MKHAVIIPITIDLVLALVAWSGQKEPTSRDDSETTKGATPFLVMKVN